MSPPPTLSDFDFELPARADRAASGRRAQRVAAARRRAATRRSTAAFRDLPELLRAGRPARLQRHPRDPGAAVRRQGERRRGRGAGRARAARTTRCWRPSARQQVAASRAARSAAERVRGRGARPRRRADDAAVPAALSGRPARAARAPRPRAAAAVHRRTPTTATTTRALPDRVRARARARSPRRPRGCISTPALLERAARARRRARARHPARRRRHVPAGAHREPRRAPDAQRVVRGRRRRPSTRSRARAPRGGRVVAVGTTTLRALEAAALRGAGGAAGRRGRDRHLHPARLPLPRRRRAGHQLPPAEEHAADAGQRVRRPRARARAVPRTRSPRATASSATATRCCCGACRRTGATTPVECARAIRRASAGQSPERCDRVTTAPSRSGRPRCRRRTRPSTVRPRRGATSRRSGPPRRRPDRKPALPSSRAAALDHFDDLRLPRERRARAAIEALPVGDDRRLAAQRLAAVDEHRVVGDEGRERAEVARRHRRCERNLRGTQAVGQCGRIRLAADRSAGGRGSGGSERQQQAAGHRVPFSGGRDRRSASTRSASANAPCCGDVRRRAPRVKCLPVR